MIVLGNREIDGSTFPGTSNYLGREPTVTSENNLFIVYATLFRLFIGELKLKLKLNPV